MDIFENNDSVNLDDISVADTTPDADDVADEDSWTDEDTQPDGTETAPDAAAEPDAQTETEPEQPAQEVQGTPPDELAIKFNHETRSIPRREAEAVAAALGVDVDTFRATYQKGMRGDQQDGRLAALEQTLDSAAQSIGTDRQGIMQMLDGAAERAAMGRIMQEVQAQHPEYSEAAVQEIAQLRLATERQQAGAVAAQREQAAEQARQQPLVDFFLRHPELDDKSIPQPVLDDYSNGNGTLEEAYLRHQMQQQAAELARVKQEQDNKKRAIGRIASETDISAVDPFLAGFMSD